MDEIFNMAMSQGVWAALSVVLIFYILKAQENRDARQEEREKNYQSIIAEITHKLGVVLEVKEQLHEIKEKLLDKK